MRAWYAELALVEGAPVPVAFAANVWRDAELLEVSSVGDTVKALRARHLRWAAHAFTLHRRTALVQEQLPRVDTKPIRFPAHGPTRPLGSWCFVDERTVLVAADCDAVVPHGRWRFEEDRTAPPSRAYLKLWEAFTRWSERPQPGEHCLDLGSSPGGWTWVLAQLGAQVTSVDRAPLTASVAALPGVVSRTESAFGLDPRAFPDATWLVCDVACYPTRLFTLVERWLLQSNCRGFVCTLKFQGETDYATIARFRGIPGSKLVHLHHNKHELTWMLARGA